MTTVNGVISIHSLRMEGDLRRHRTYRRMRGFQSTPSAWRETAMQYAETLRQRISIHSLRMEGDYHRMCYIRRLWDFNPLPPHGGRPISSEPTAATISFQSTPSAWRETETVVPPFPSTKFQSTPSAWRETTASFLACASF